MRLSAPLAKLLAFEDQQEDRIALRLRIGPAANHRDVPFGELRDSVARHAGALASAGCRRGERVALLMPHSERLIISFFGCLYAGFVPSIIAWPTTKMDPEKYRRNVTTVVGRLAADHLVTDSSSAARLGSSVGKANIIDPWLVDQTKAAGPSPLEAQTLLIQFSGGTTGAQKSVPLTDTHLRAQLESYSDSIGLNAEDAIISWLPLYHDMGLIACLVMPFLYRLPVSVFAPMEWVMDPRPFLETMGSDRATLCWLPNFAFSFMATRVKSPTTSMDLSTLRAAINCSEPVRADSMEAFFTKFSAAGLDRRALQVCYAMAETTFAVTQTPAGETPRQLSVARGAFGEGRLVAATENARVLVSCGRPISGAEVRVVNEAGAAVEQNEIGEIEIRAPFVMTDYLDSAERGTRSSFRDDWYRTGDLGALVDDEIYVTGRKKDLIIVGGVNVYPEDVESAVGGVAGIRAGRTVAMGIEDATAATERLVVVAEVDSLELLQRAPEMEAMVRAAISVDCGVAAGAVFLVGPQWIVKSTAGKISRSETKARVLANWTTLNGNTPRTFSPVD